MAGRRLALFALLALTFQTAHGLECYRCVSTNSSQPFLCNEFLTDAYDIKPESCDDVYGAKYCIKHVGRFEALTLDCYQCTSADNWMCENSELVTAHMQPQNCNYVFEARYCVKAVGRYGGGIGTKRLCSSVDLGNFCDYVKQPGDKLTYRTCLFTCNSNGCNPASIVLPSTLLNVFLSAIGFGFFFLR
ncbi:PREDICTED: uncharacterized protein LOC105364028 [Ceratosolen solmsi marchali]|uniref:Uncharacterized protein LOC105364028 n=1 Tax=Ceratosolen solmsi marchali TaxID=326594 RepID=A0AAJ6YLB8_9HYME|nr:PREDICTED: uncharacterized protein LOC105364028 [Ceratosolen solmsi marchali]